MPIPNEDALQPISPNLNVFLRENSVVTLGNIPTAPNGATNVQWQMDTFGNISAYGGGGSTPVTLQNVFASAGTQNYVHNLNTPNPITTFYVNSGSATFTVAVVDNNTIAITTTGAATITGVFLYAPPVPASFSFSVATNPLTYVPALAAIESIPFTITQVALGGYAGSPVYSVTGGPAGLSGTYSPTSITGSGTAALVVHVPYNQPSGSNNFTASATDGTITRTSPVSLTLATTNDGLIEGWPSNEGSGSLLRTVTSSGDNANGTAVTWTTPSGFPVPVATYNGTTTVAIGATTSTTDFDGTTPFSGCFWANVTSSAPVDQGIMGTIDVSGAIIPGWDFEFVTFGSLVSPIFRLINNIGTNLIDVRGTTGATVGVTHFVCFTYDGSKSASGVKIYLDGSPVATSTNANTLTGSAVSGNPIRLGARKNGAGSTNFLGGTLGYVRLYNRVLSSSEVSTLFAVGPR